jgi:hypothetical protein
MVQDPQRSNTLKVTLAEDTVRNEQNSDVLIEMDGECREGTPGREQAVATRYGCEGRASSRGETRGGEAVVVVIGTSRALETATGKGRDTPQCAETQRTPGSAAGCNKPANRRRRKPAKW